MKKIWLALGITPIIAVTLFLFAFSQTGYFLNPPQDGVLVTRVIDGDTIVIEGGERVRLIGIDTPEKGQPLYTDAKEFMEKLVLGKRIRLEKDTTDKDKYQRLLRYVYLGDLLVNIEPLKEGLATSLIIRPDDMFSDLILSEEAKAREAGLGIWSVKGEFCLSIFFLHSNAKGNDNQNLNDEFVTFRNKCTDPIQLEGYTMSDRGRNTFSFPEISLPGKGYLTVHTGNGQANLTDLFWGKEIAVWNNNGDSLLLLDPSGHTALNYTY